MKSCLTKLSLILLFSIPSLAVSEEFYYNFGNSLSGDQNLVNMLGSYEFTPSANDFRDHSFEPSYGNSNVSLANGQFLATPPSVSTFFDFNKPVQFDLRFKFDDAVTISSEKLFIREILTTTTSDQRDEGFTLLVREESGSWLLQFQVGEGSGLQPPYNDVEGYVKTLAYIDPHSWQKLSIIFRLNETTPRVDFILNGSSQSMVLGEARRADISKLITLLSGGDYYNKAHGLDKLQIFAGGFPIADIGCCDPRVHDSTLVLDYLHIMSPKTLANAGEMSALLKSMTDHVNEKTVLSVAELSQISQSFLIRFGGDWDSIASEALEFLEAYSAKYPPIFERYIQEEYYPKNFSPEKTLVFYLQKWIFDNLFVSNTLNTVSEMRFEDADVFPGIVSTDAPRIVKSIEFDGDYVTDPGYVLNNQETVFRPTGLYVAPGEIVTLDFEATAINKGLIARIGIHRFDLEAGNFTYFSRFPRISNTFAIDQQQIKIANPFGGGLYFEVPDGSSLGKVKVTVAGAVKMPMYSTLDLEGHSSDLGEFTSDLSLHQVPWFEITGDKFTTTQSMNARNFASDPQGLIDVFGDMFDAISAMTGRPLERIRSEWLAVDSQITVLGTAMAASYPIFGDQKILAPSETWPVSDETWFAPWQYLNKDFFAANVTDNRKRQRDAALILWHEWGHLHNQPTLSCQEGESNVHMLAAVAYNKVLGADLDTALKYSGFQQYTLDDSALDTMLSPNWQKGRRLCLDEWDNEVRYQTRSWARLVDLVKMFGWDSVGSIHKAFYDQGVLEGKAVNYGLEDDYFVITASNALSLNLIPVFEFWGIPVTAETKQVLASLTVPAEFEQRLDNYKNLVPKTMAEFYVIHQRLSATTGSAGRWDDLEKNFGLGTVALMTARIDTILCDYYDKTQSCLPDEGDIDGDGILNSQDIYVFDNSNNNLGIRNFNWNDSDGDGVADNNDPFPEDSSKSLDTDLDGIADSSDDDDDGDGLLDVSDDFPLDSTNGVFLYQLLYGHYEITGCAVACVKDLSIPSLINGRNVRRIGNEAFKGQALTNVTLPDTLSEIGARAFDDNLLNRIDIPNGLKRIGERAFADNQIITANLPDGLEDLGKEAFENNLLVSMTLPDSLIQLGWNVFASNRLESVKLPAGISNIPRGLFKSNQLSNVRIPSSVVNIGEESFIENQLTSITIPASVAFIETLAFNKNPLTTMKFLGDRPTFGITPVELYGEKIITYCSNTLGWPGEPIGFYEGFSGVIPINDCDGDGVLDPADAFPLDPTNDSDDDGVANNADVYPENSLYSKDSDNDGMPDAWETRYGLNPNDPSDATSDQDNDGVSAIDEFLGGSIPSGSLDIDGNGQYDALTDGLLLLRGMFGLDASALVTGTIASDAAYTESVDIEARIATLGDLADIDGNGTIDALTDGLLTLRYLFGLEGDTLIAGVVAPDATRTTAVDIEAHLKTLMPTL